MQNTYGSHLKARDTIVNIDFYQVKCKKKDLLSSLELVECVHAHTNFLCVFYMKEQGNWTVYILSIPVEKIIYPGYEKL